MTTANICTDKRSTANKHSWILLAFLPIPSRFVPGFGETYDQSRARHAQAIDIVISRVLKPLKEFNTQGEGIPMDCGDGYRRRCYPILSSWLSDHEENAKLHAIAENWCPVCTTDWHMHQVYQEPDDIRKLHRLETTATIAHRYDNPTKGQQPWASPLWGFPLCNSYSLHRPDLLHTIQLGMLKYIMSWVHDFLSEHGRLSAFDKAWSSTTSYPGFARPTKKYSETTQWNGKEMLQFSHLILPCFVAALSSHPNPPNDTKKEYRQATNCVKYLLYFVIYSYYNSHDDESLKEMDSFLDHFHRCKEIFRKYRRNKNTKDYVHDEMTKIRQRDNDAYAARKHTMTRLQRENYEKEMKKQWMRQERELFHAKGEFNFVKIHLMLHFFDTVKQRGPLPQFTTEKPESLHRSIVKRGFSMSNHNDSYIDQIFSRYSQQFCLDMRLSSLQAVSRHYELPKEALVTIGAIENTHRRILSRANRRAHLLAMEPEVTPNDLPITPFYPEDVDIAHKKVRYHRQHPQHRYSATLTTPGTRLGSLYLRTEHAKLLTTKSRHRPTSDNT